MGKIYAGLGRDVAMRRRTLAMLGCCLLLLSAGCVGFDGGLLTSDDELSFSEQDHEDVYQHTIESLDEDEASAFTAAITENGTLSTEGEAFLAQLTRIEDIGTDQRDAVARSVAERGDVDQDLLADVDRILQSPESFQEDVFGHGLDVDHEHGLLVGEINALEASERELILDIARSVRDGGYTEDDLAFLHGLSELDDVQYALIRTDGQERLEVIIRDGSTSSEDIWLIEDDAGDGVANGLHAFHHGDPSESHPELAALLDAIEDDGVDANDLAVVRAVIPAPITISFAEALGPEDYPDHEVVYIERVSAISHDRDNPYEKWSQAEELGLLHDAIEDGTVSEETVWAIQNNASNRLLNGMEVEFGTDPEKADTSGDGFEDHLKWGPMQDLGLTVHPDQVDVYIEVESDRHADAPSSAQQETIRAFFQEEAPDDIGPVHVHFFEYRDDLEPVEDIRDMQSQAQDRNLDGIGFHYLVMTDTPFYYFGDPASGAAWVNPLGPSWMVVVDSHSTDFVTATIVHEMGHGFGILPTDFEGVDSHAYSADDYPSVMNYNVHHELMFSSGDPFDDWAWMAEQRFGADHLDRSGLETMWEAGSVPEQIEG